MENQHIKEKAFTSIHPNIDILIDENGKWIHLWTKEPKRESIVINWRQDLNAWTILVNSKLQVAYLNRKTGARIYKITEKPTKQ